MKISCLIIIYVLICFVVNAQPTEEKGYPKPSKIQLSWQEMEQIMFVHFGPATWQNHEYDDLSTPLSRINPEKLNTDQWVKVAKSYGAKMILFVAKHTGGFCWWQTKTTDYSVKNTPWKNGNGDVMADLARSCKKYGLKLGVYLSPEDRYMNVGMGGVSKKPELQHKYEETYRKQLTELLTGYGDIYEIWVDGSLVFDITDQIKKYAPKAVIFQSSAATIRWVGNELGFAPYPAWNTVKKADARSGNSTADHSTPIGDTWLPIESDVSIRRPDWFWKTNNSDRVLSLEELLQIYYCSVGRGTTLLINTCPDTTGLIPVKDSERLAEFGKEINKRFEKTIEETRGEGKSLRLLLKGEREIDHIVLMEDIKYGERVREFKIELFANSKWIEVFNGSAIGQKLIVQFPALKTTEVRLTISKSVDTPVIKSMKAFCSKAEMVEMPKVMDSWKLRNVGEWEVANNNTPDIEIELSPYCKDAQSYEVAFVLNDGLGNQPKFLHDWVNAGLWLDNITENRRLKILEKNLIFDGVNANQYLFSDEKFEDRVHFNLTGIAPSIKIKVKLQLPREISKTKIQAFLLRK